MRLATMWFDIVRSGGRAFLVRHSQPKSNLVRWISGSSFESSSKPEDVARRTCLYDTHVRKGAKMVPFAGYQMPVQYGNESISSSHIHTREHVGIFDVSHMLQTKLHGADRVAFVESLTVADVAGLKDDRGTLTVYTTERGGIIDDLIVTKTSQGYLYVVSNAGCRDKDLAHVQAKLIEFRANGGDARLEIVEDRALLAIQGPGMHRVVQPLVDVDLTRLGFMNTVEGTLAGVPGCRITRCGYTGEDGVEVSVPEQKAAEIVETLLSSKEDSVRLAGLGARDSLRLEAGLCLYGNDINETTTPIEASLAWLIGKRRRESADFPGAQVILAQLKNKPSRKRVGLVSSGAPARSHTVILNEAGTRVGEVTSGCPSPSLKYNVAMGYVSEDLSKVGTKLKLEIRKNLHDAQVVKMPFVAQRYYVLK